MILLIKFDSLFTHSQKCTKSLPLQSTRPRIQEDIFAKWLKLAYCVIKLTFAIWLI